MPRWRQTTDPETGKSKFVPIDDEARRIDGHFVQGDISSFVSPIDGSVISDRKQYREHCEKHGVVPAGEFSKEHYERKAQERADHYEGRKSSSASLEIKQSLYEAMIREERKHGW